ncbi:MAG: DUF192 domain-containing protein [Candidatus Dormibacteraeota bacterium]|nr:DUF192 domain-containing protein [Candidatus Dormibacteraeota bacterium]
MARTWRVLRLRHVPSGRVLAERLLVPSTFVGRGLGLMFRPALAQGQGMWIQPCNGIHMFGVRFPLDAIFLDRAERLVSAHLGLRPWRVVPFVAGSRSVVELPAGSLSGLPLERGEQFSIEPHEAEGA